MKKLYDKSEIWFAVACIMVYVLTMGNLQANFGTGSLYSAAGLMIIVGVLLAFIRKYDLAEKYGLVRVTEYRRFLYYIPLLLIGTVNLWFGAKLHYDMTHQLIALVTMALSGIAEELIFRGLLFRAMERDDLRSAIIVTSVTFGAGHIVNLLTGAASAETFMQILYAIAIGFAFVLVTYKSGSIVPCILTHCLINMTAELSVEAGTTASYVQVAFLLIVAGGYALYLRRVSI